MNLKHYLIASILFAISINSYAQSDKTFIHVQDPVLKLQNDTIYVAFDVNVNKLASSYRIEFHPIVQLGSNEVAMPLARVYGRLNKQLESRKQALNLKTYKAFEGHSVMVGNALKYCAAIPYASWMSNGAMKLNIIMSGCCKKKRSDVVLVHNLSELLGSSDHTQVDPWTDMMLSEYDRLARR